MSNQTIEYNGFTIVKGNGRIRILNPYKVTVCDIGGTAKNISHAKTIIDDMLGPKSTHVTEMQRRAFTRRFNKLAGF